LWRDRGRASADVKAVALGHVAGLKAKIAELRATARTLEHLAATCSGDGRPDCPILDDLAMKAEATAQAGGRTVRRDLAAASRFGGAGKPSTRGASW
jgi:hypothetical protein